MFLPSLRWLIKPILIITWTCYLQSHLIILLIQINGMNISDIILCNKIKESQKGYKFHQVDRNTPKPSHLPALTWSLLIPVTNFSAPAALLSLVGFGSLVLSQGCWRHADAVGRFSGAKSRRGLRNCANSRASGSGNLYFSTRRRSIGQYFSLRILLRSPYLSK